MSKIEGVAKKYDGAAIDYVSIFNWADGKCIAQVVPDAAGNWEFAYAAIMTVGITYVANGCEPVAHGPYDLAVDDNTQSPPVLYYTFDNTLADASVNANDGVKSGSVVFAAGRKASTFSADFIGGCISSSSVLPINGSDITLSFWLNLNSSKTAIIAETTKDVNKNNAMSIYQVAGSPNKLTIAVRQVDGDGVRIANSTADVTSNSIAIGSWVHIVVSIQRKNTTNQIAAYINGIDSITKTNFQDISNDFDNAPLYIGARGASSLFADAKVQDLRIYNRIITDAERTALYSE